MTEIAAVLFDVGGTLLRVHPSVGEVYAAAAERHGFSVEPRRLEARFREAWKAAAERAKERGYRTSNELQREEWRRIVRATFSGLVPEEAVAPIFEDLYAKFVNPEAWCVARGAREALEYLRGRAVHLGVLSNWDSRLPGTLERLGLLSYFDSVTVSYEVGFEKPHREIFRKAAARAGQPPSRILHVGDSLTCDILPARALGMRTLWVYGVEEGREAGTTGIVLREGGPAVASLSQLDAAGWAKLLGGEGRLETA